MFYLIVNKFALFSIFISRWSSEGNIKFSMISLARTVANSTAGYLDKICPNIDCHRACTGLPYNFYLTIIFHEMSCERRKILDLVIFMTSRKTCEISILR